MNANTQLPNKNIKTFSKVFLLIVGIGIATLTLPSFESHVQQDNVTIAEYNFSSSENIELITQVSNKNISYHNFLASYFLQESSYNRSDLKASESSTSIMTLAKLPFSVALNVWSNLSGH